MRTNIDIDDKLMKAAMKATGAMTKKAAVESALRKLVEIRARERKMEEIYRQREIARKAAERGGCLDDWRAALEREHHGAEN